MQQKNIGNVFGDYLRKNKSRTLLRAVMLTIVLTSCSNGGGASKTLENSNEASGYVTSLQIINPKVMYSLSSGISLGYVVINNPTANAVKNLHYSIDGQIGSAKVVEIESASAINCAQIAAYSQCNLKVSIPKGAVAGSFALTATNGNSLLGKLKSKVITETNPIIVTRTTYAK